jgi:uncharacterized protein (TIGR03086 family)
MNHSVGVTLKFAQFASGATDCPATPKGDLIGSDHVAALRTCRAVAQAAWAATDMTRSCQLSFGRFRADLAAGINLFDVLAHTWDMAEPIDVQVDIDTEIWIAGLEAAKTVIGPHRDPAHYAQEIAVGPAASAKDQFLAFLGRGV